MYEKMSTRFTYENAFLRNTVNKILLLTSLYSLYPVQFLVWKNAEMNGKIKNMLHWHV